MWDELCQLMGVFCCRLGCWREEHSELHLQEVFKGKLGRGVQCEDSREEGWEMGVGTWLCTCPGLPVPLWSQVTPIQMHQCYLRR